MKLPWLLAALGVVAVSNAFVFTHVGRNRSSPDSRMSLGDRELENVYANTAEDSRVHLRLRWNNPTIEFGYLGTTNDPPAWANEDRMKQLGFDTRLPPEPSDTLQHFYRMPPREVFVALELGGPSFEEWLRNRDAKFRAQPAYQGRMSPEENLEVERNTSSRLVAIDLASGPAELRRKYPDGSKVMILRGLVHLAGNTEKPRVYGQIQRVLNDQIYVPHDLSDALPRDYSPFYVRDPQTGLKFNEPRFVADVVVGGNFEPWVADLRKR
jgi:hypothetical protein